MEHTDARRRDLHLRFSYLNYSSATTSTLQLLWRKGGGALEVVPRESIRARGRRDYYSFGGAVVAMKEGVLSSAPRVLTYLHGDHLGSVSLATDASGNVVSQQRYKPYGELRWSSGVGMPTDPSTDRITGPLRAGFTFTLRRRSGQRAGPANYVGLLMDYVARGYSPGLGRFISADTIVPGAGNSQAYNRYMYVGGNPLGRIDPTGHAQWCAGSDAGEPPTICTATGDTLTWEQYLRSELENSALGKELLARYPDLFEHILWEQSIIDWGANHSSTRKDFQGHETYIIELQPHLRGNFKGSGVLTLDELVPVLHEVFHTYQRHIDPSRQHVETTLQMEREAFAFAGAVTHRPPPGNPKQKNEGMRPYVASQSSAYSAMRNAIYFFSKLTYSLVTEGTAHSGDLVLAFTVDLGFSYSSVEEIYDAAGLSMPSMQSSPR